jgi:hypothetical protein
VAAALERGPRPLRDSGTGSDRGTRRGVTRA